MDVAHLGFRVDSAPAAKGAKDLDVLAASAKRAEKATTGMSAASGKAAVTNGAAATSAAAAAKATTGAAVSLGRQTIAATGSAAATRAAAVANDNAAGAAERLTRNVTGTSVAFRTLRTVVAPLLALFSVGALAKYGDTWSTLEWRVRNATGSVDAARQTMDRLAKVARASWSPIEQVAEGYLRQEAALSALGYSTSQQIDLLEALNSAILISGMRGQRAEMIADAWAKAMARGTLRGDELNTVLLNSSRLSELLADKMGVPVNELRKLGEQGKITTDVMFGITDQLGQLRKEMEGDATLAGGFVILRNELLKFFGALDQATKITSRLGSVIVLLAENIGRIITYAATAVTMYGTYYVAAFVAANLATITLSASLAFLRAALIRTGIGALVIAAGELVYQFYRLVQAAGGFGNAMGLLGDVAVEVWDRIRLGAQSLVASLDAGWEGMKAAFFYALHDMAAGFADFIGGVAASINRVFGTDLNTAPMSGMLADLNAAGNSAMVGRNASRKSAAGLWDQATAPLESIQAIRDVMSEAAKETDGAAEAAARLNNALENTGGGNGVADKAAKAIKDGAKKATDQLSEAAQAAKGFLSTLRQGLMQGKSLWESFGNAVLGVLDKIMDKAETALANALFPSSGGGFFGSLLGGIGKLFGFASGGYTGSGAASQVAGVVHGGEYVFSKRATDRIGVSALDQLHRQAKGYADGGHVAPVIPRVQAPANDRGQSVHVTVGVSVDKSGNLQAYVKDVAQKEAGQVSTAAIGQYDKSMPGRINDVLERHG